MDKDRYIQALRGLAIAAVVLIHCLSESAASVALRPLLNWAVALFLFLSGMLTTEEIVVGGGVVKRRLLKVALPYFAWSVMYLVARRPNGAVWALLTGGASAQMYYLLVYAQMTIITPVLFRLLKRCRAALYAVTPCMIIAWEFLALLGIDAPNVGVLFPAWLIYYLFGLEWERWHERLRKKRDAVAAVAALALLAQMGEGSLWYACGDYNMATTQLRLTNVLSSLAVITLFMTAAGRARERLSGCRPLVLLGDLSFGVYLCHIAVLMVLGKVLGLMGLASPSVLWVTVLFASVLLIVTCRRILPHRLLRLLGFA